MTNVAPVLPLKYTSSLTLSIQEADKTYKAEQQLHGLLAKSQDLQDTHNALASRAQKLERVHASGQGNCGCAIC